MNIKRVFTEPLGYRGLFKRKIKMNEEIRNYMSSIGRRGGSAKTPAQIAAHRDSLAIARRKRWPQKKVGNTLPTENSQSSTTKKDVDK